MNLDDGSDPVIFGSTDSQFSKRIRFKAPNGNSIIIDGVTDGTVSRQPGIKFNTCRSHLNNPLTVEKLDILNSFSWNGYDGNEYIGSLSLAGIVDNDTIPLEGSIPGKLVIITYPDGGCGNIHKYLTFDSSGRLGINTFDAKATCDINGIMRLTPQDIPPLDPVEGMIAVADGKQWNPNLKSNNLSYPVYYNGVEWISMI